MEREKVKKRHFASYMLRKLQNAEGLFILATVHLINETVILRGAKYAANTVLRFSASFQANIIGCPLCGSVGKHFCIFLFVEVLASTFAFSVQAESYGQKISYSSKESFCDKQEEHRLREGKARQRHKKPIRCGPAAGGTSRSRSAQKPTCVSRPPPGSRRSFLGHRRCIICCGRRGLRQQDLILKNSCLTMVVAVLCFSPKAYPPPDLFFLRRPSKDVDGGLRSCNPTATVGG
ncbi:hypothetical protein T265_06217 [Opisthorchis viverrini]|uniref:Uncharacterized protein n=1 Tax=Opisthorchis viverrini TaxID=6198 RepID=A0A075AE93_OPIVI|nr:hypothetical protein T265_06217 [Opisthorchis viverrini]KER26574.1 hypothetical protein T265_06217 [Opisthorchis viverrini]